MHVFINYYMSHWLCEFRMFENFERFYDIDTLMEYSQEHAGKVKAYTCKKDEFRDARKWVSYRYHFNTIWVLKARYVPTLSLRLTPRSQMG